jgi:energy-coupling factor transporter ATP-binding protein EcfA2
MNTLASVSEVTIMSFTPTLEDLERLVAESFKTDDIEERADQAGLAQERLVALLSDKTKEIWDAGSGQQVQVEKLEAEYESKLTTRITRSLQREARTIKALRTSAYVLPIYSLVYLALWYFKVTKAGLWVITQRPAWLVPSILGGAFIAAFVYYRFRKSRYDSEEYFARDRIEEDPEFVDLKKKIVEAKKTVDAAVIAQGIKPKIRELLATRLNLSFSSHLSKLDFSGLSEVFNSANEVATDAKRQLEFMLNTMPGGSVGIAGPRGSGKSTLLKSACAEMPGNIDKRKVMPLLTTSPVEYQGRDFILHLFSSMCVKILETTTNRKRAHAALEEVAELRQPATISIFRVLGPLAPFALMLGVSLIVFSVILALLTMNTPPPAPAANTQAQTAQTQPAQPTQSPAPAQQTPTPAPSFVVRLVQALDLKPGTLFISGLLLVLFYVVLRYYFRGVRRFNQRYASNWDSVVYGLNVDYDTKQRLLEISNEARVWLREIKFQQSYTSGWSGALKLPIGLEGGISTAVSLAQQQLSLPDITSGFCDFLSAIARDFTVIIGIDELDKLESDEAAQRFLNEIKAIFGIPNVFYLISVSENAMSNFERRGLPFRDVFDSSFDNIVYVEYLNLEQAKRLIARRVIAMPPPFVHLCYCISGGLARDLVRACRNLMQYSHKAHALAAGGPDSNLKALTAALIKSDLGLKLHALIVVAKKLAVGPGLNSFLDKLHWLENELDSSPSLLQAYEDLLKGARPLPSDKAMTNGANGLVEVYDKLKERLSGDVPNADDTKMLYSLHEELASYIYYCVTLLQFFSEVLDANTLVQAEQGKAFDELARARQYLAINPSITRTMLDKFRKSFNMAVPITTPIPAVVS